MAVLTDDGLSGGKRRDNADKALAMLSERTADVLAVWRFDRWSRMGIRAVADLADVLEERTDALFVTFFDNLRSDSQMFGMYASMLAETAKAERQNIQVRVKSSIARLRTTGRYAGGNVPFGYEPADSTDGPGRILVVVPSEAIEIKKAAKAVLEGKSIYAVIKDVNARGVKTRRGLRWNPENLQRILTSDVISGYVIHHKELVRDEETGQPIQFWEPVLDPDDVRRIRARYANERPPKGQRKRKEGARLLSGLVYCAYCDSPMYPWTSTSAAKPITSYVCGGQGKGKECPSVTVTADRLEERVEKDFLSKYGALQMFNMIESESYQTDLAQLDVAIHQISAKMTERDADIDPLLEQLKFFRDRRSELEAIEVKPSVLEPTGSTFNEAWANVGDRRRILMANIDKILVLKGHKGKRGPLEFRRVRIEWREPQFEAYVEASNYRPDVAVVPKDMQFGPVRARVLIKGEMIDL